MARKIAPQHLAYETWIVHSVEVGQHHGSATLRDTIWYTPNDDEGADVLYTAPGAKGAEFMEYNEHEITLPVSPQTLLRPGMHVRLTIEQVA